ncbi:hypothetical protein D9M69_318820 [compost metagenome]
MLECFFAEGVEIGQVFVDLGAGQAERLAESVPSADVGNFVTVRIDPFFALEGAVQLGFLDVSQLAQTDDVGKTSDGSCHLYLAEDLVHQVAFFPHIRGQRSSVLHQGNGFVVQRCVLHQFSSLLSIASHVLLLMVSGWPLPALVG